MLSTIICNERRIGNKEGRSPLSDNTYKRSTTSSRPAINQIAILFGSKRNAAAAEPALFFSRYPTILSG